MAEYVRVPKEDWVQILDKVREKTGSSDTMISGDVPDAIDGISVGVPINNQNKTITENGEYTFDEGYTGFGVVTVNVAASGGSEIEEQFIAVIERDSSKPVTELPAGLTKIGDNAFYNNYDLTLTSLPDGVTSIGSSAFANCIKLALTSLPDGVTSIGSSAFVNCYAIEFTSLPDGVTNISDRTFSGCCNFKLESLPDGVTNIGTEAFSQCSNLAIPYLPRSLRTIGQKAFSGCTKLAISSIPSGVTEIGNQAFYGCSGLTEIVFEGKPNTINSYAFQSCTNLLTINVPWAEGEVANAPWGATKATINYNYVPEPEEPEEPEDPVDPADKYTWDAVLASIDAGTYATDYAIGDMVPLDLGDEGLINMQIAAFDTDDLADGSGKAPITWIATTPLATERRWNPALVTNDDGSYQEGTGDIGGWEKSELRSYLDSSVKALLPANVRNAIKEVTKVSLGCDTSGKYVDTNSNDYLWVPANYEFKHILENHHAREGSGVTYGSVTKDMLKLRMASGSAFEFCTRTSYKYNGMVYRIDTQYVEFRNASANKDYKVILCFCT